GEDRQRGESVAAPDIEQPARQLPRDPSQRQQRFPYVALEDLRPLRDARQAVGVVPAREEAEVNQDRIEGPGPGRLSRGFEQSPDVGTKPRVGRESHASSALAGSTVRVLIAPSPVE